MFECMRVFHHDALLQWCANHAVWLQKCDSIIFSNEKKLNTDELNDYKHIRHDLGRETPSFYSPHSGSRVVMVWAAISIKGKTNLTFVHTNLN